MATFHEISNDQWQIFKNKFTFEDASKNIGKMKTSGGVDFFRKKLSVQSDVVFEWVTAICQSEICAFSSIGSKFFIDFHKNNNYYNNKY